MAIKKPSKTDKKHAYDQKLCQLLDEYSRVLVAAADNVGSSQLAEIRRGIRGESVMLMGKNTLIRRCITAHAERTGNANIKAIIPLLQGNVGLIFTKGDLKEVREEVAKYKVGAPARVGLLAPIDVVVPPGNTGLDPSQTSFFQVLNIPTKINKGSVEMVAHVDLIKKGDKVGSSEAALLAKLGIRPFSYGLVITNVYDDGSVFSPEVLDLTEEDLMEKFACGVSMVASLSLAVLYPTLAAAPHMFLNGYKNVLAVAVETDYSFPDADQIKEYLKVGAPARVGLLAPIDVVVPPGNTGLDPSQTSFFQVLNIPTKINKGSVEMVAHVDLIKKGDKVGSSEAALLAKLGIRPFSYGLVITNVYDDGSVFSPEVLDLTEEDLMEKFACGVSMVASLSLAVLYPTLAAAPHMFLNGYKNVLAVAVETDYSFPDADQIKEYLKDPSKFAVAAVPSGGGGATAAAAAPEEEKKEEESDGESESGEGFMNLFDD